MSTCHRQTSIRRRHLPLAGTAIPAGFSLLELIVVVAILVVLAAMAAPNLINQIRENRVARAAESVREIISEARSYAVDSGIDYQFRYESNGRRFVVLPRELEPQDSRSTDGDTSTGNSLRLFGELDESFHLVAAEDAEQATESLEAAWFGQLPGASRLAQANWSAPVLFHFDGRAEDAAFRITTDSQLAADLTIRGLTGAVRVSAVYPEAD